MHMVLSVTLNVSLSVCVPVEEVTCCVPTSQLHSGAALMGGEIKKNIMYRLRRNTEDCHMLWTVGLLYMHFSYLSICPKFEGAGCGWEKQSEVFCSSSRVLQPALSGFGLIVITVRTACLMEHWELITAQSGKKKKKEARMTRGTGALRLALHLSLSAVTCEASRLLSLCLCLSAVCLRSRQHVAHGG